MKRQALDATLTGRARQVIFRKYAIFEKGGQVYKIYFATGKVVKVK